MNRASGVVALLAGVACSAGTESNLADISGHWEFTETLEDKVHGFSCADTGIYDISQVGDRFVGRYGQSGVCITPGGPVNNEDSGTVDAGRIVGRTIRFMVTANCEYEGNASGMPTTALAGKGLCIIEDANRTLSLTGTWRAMR